jgi:hypothetical protein
MSPNQLQRCLVCFLYLHASASYMTTVKVNNFLPKFLMVRILALIYCHQQAGLPSSNMTRLTSPSLGSIYYVAIKTLLIKKDLLPFKYLYTRMVITLYPLLGRSLRNYVGSRFLEIGLCGCAAILLLTFKALRSTVVRIKKKLLFVVLRHSSIFAYSIQLKIRCLLSLHVLFVWDS